MILERNNFLNIRQLQREFRGVENNERIKEIGKFLSLYQLYQSGSNEISTKLENLDAEFQVNYDYNPIHHMEARMKSIQSLANKVIKKNIPLTVNSISENIFDIAGIRVVTNYIDDIYKIADLLIQQDDVTLFRTKDYIKNPKPSGYRSLHLVVSVPVFQSKGSKNVPVEIQIRTVGMDMWASLEHKLKYKTQTNKNLVEKYSKQLITYSNELNEIEKNMQNIHNDLL